MYSRQANQLLGTCRTGLSTNIHAFLVSYKWVKTNLSRGWLKLIMTDMVSSGKGSLQTCSGCCCLRYTVFKLCEYKCLIPETH